MREIKFRAWHKTEQKMYSVLSLHFTLGGKLFGILGDGGKILEVTDVELMEYTGLKDNIGQAICEGDIIRYYEGLLESHFNSVVAWKTTEIQDDISTVPLQVAGFIIGSLGDIEIIGNIWEHGDLLKG